MSTLRDLLRGYREQQGLTQEGLAALVEPPLSPKTISNLERGKTRPYRHTLEAVCRALRLDDSARQELWVAWRATGTDRIGALASDMPAPSLIGRELELRALQERMLRPAPERHNLPAPHPRLIGREHDSAAVRDLALQVPARLVTLTGTGGCGKTQLALLVAAGLVDTFAHGVWLVELAPLQAPHLVPYAVASVLRRRERAGEGLTDTLVAYLKTRECLLILDNCEHLIDACADLAERLLAGCPRVRLLATSRERLRISAETTWRVPSLSSPDPRTTLAPSDVLAYPAVQLFVERARAVQPDIALGTDSASCIAGICARLEGLPLALELAAARVATLSLPQILERLDDSFRLLASGSRTAPTRQRTLRATLEWSHGLLSDVEQAVFRRLAVFVGGWSLEAAEAVCAGTVVTSADVLEILSRLVDKSLVEVEADARDGRSRYQLLVPIRQYAREQLVASREQHTLAQRHAAFFLDFAEALERDASMGGARRIAAADAIQAEYRNLQAALRRALDTQDAELGLRLAWTLQYVWKFRLPLGEGRPWLEEVLAVPGAEAPTPARAVSLLTAAWAAWGRGDHLAADRYYAEALPLARRLGDAWILVVALTDRGVACEHRGDYEAARTLWQEALATARASGDRAAEAIALGMSGRLDIFEGKYATGRALVEECLRLARQIGDDWIMWGALNALALAALAQDDLATARALSIEGLRLDPTRRTGALLVLGQVAIADGDYMAARGHLLEALALLANSGDPVAIAQVVEALAQLASLAGQSDVAMRLAAAVEAAQDTLDVVQTRSLAAIPHAPLSRDLRERWLVPLRKSVRAEDARRWWAEGRALSLDEALALAKSSMPMIASTSVPQTTAALFDPLTLRQKEVAVLVADGLTNRQIAARLVITERAAGAHIEHILDKLGVGSRAQIAVWASERGLLTRHSG